jgi:hypothetical protein
MTQPVPSQKTEQSELNRYGIITVPTKVYTWGGFRYTNARDALAAAKRGGAPSPGK